MTLWIGEDADHGAVGHLLRAHESLPAPALHNAKRLGHIFNFNIERYVTVAAVHGRADATVDAAARRNDGVVVHYRRELPVENALVEVFKHLLVLAENFEVDDRVRHG